MKNRRIIKDLQKAYLNDVLLRRTAGYKKIISKMIKETNDYKPTYANDSLSDIKRVLEAEIKLFNKSFSLNVLKKSVNKFIFKRLKMKNQRSFLEFGKKNLRMRKYLTALKIKEGLSINEVIESEQLQGFLKDSVVLNVEMIKTMDKRIFEDIRTVVYQNTTGNVSTKDLKEKLLDLGAKSDFKAKQIAVDQVNKINENMSRLRNENLGITKFTWLTSGKNNVRDEHSSFHGKVFTYKDGAGKRGILPAQDVYCQCIAVPYVDDFES